MVIAPCSIKTLAALASCHADTLIARAGDVALKEGRPLLALVRETPLHVGHLRQMLAFAEMGGIVFPPVPAFYQKPAERRRHRRPHGGARARATGARPRARARVDGRGTLAVGRLDDRRRRALGAAARLELVAGGVEARVPQGVGDERGAAPARTRSPTSGATSRTFSRKVVIHAATAVTASRGRRGPPPRLAATWASSDDLEEDERRVAAQQVPPGPGEQLTGGRRAEVRPGLLDDEVGRPPQEAAVDPVVLDGRARHRLGPAAPPRDAAGPTGRRRLGRLGPGRVEAPPEPRELDLRRRAHLDVVAPRREPLEVGHVLAARQVPDQDLARRAGRPRRRTAACGP